MTIFAGLLLFLLATAAGAVALVIVHEFVDLDEHLNNVLVYGVLGGAAVISLRFIYRSRDR